MPRPAFGPLIAALGLALSGCAQVTGWADDVAVNSEPPGAACRIERMGRTIAQVKETPATVTIDRSHYPVDIYCTKEGLAGALTVTPGVNPFVYGDVIGGGVPYVFDSLVDADRTLPEAVLVRFPMQR
jgi:hypothetical protein